MKRFEVYIVLAVLIGAYALGWVSRPHFVHPYAIRMDALTPIDLYACRADENCMDIDVFDEGQTDTEVCLRDGEKDRRLCGR